MILITFNQQDSSNNRHWLKAPNTLPAPSGSIACYNGTINDKCYIQMPNSRITSSTVPRFHNIIEKLTTERLGHGFLILCLSKPPMEPVHCRPKNKKQTSLFIFLPTADSISMLLSNQ